MLALALMLSISILYILMISNREEENGFND
jgi:hypothetical protein